MSRALVKLGDLAVAVVRDAMNDPETPAYVHRILSFRVCYNFVNW